MDALSWEGTATLMDCCLVCVCKDQEVQVRVQVRVQAGAGSFDLLNGS